MSWPTHPDSQALFKTILDTPDDDAPRLVFADWLDENGYPERAEYIRLECTLARDRFADEHAAIRRRRDALHEEFKNVWHAELASLPGVAWAGSERGFYHRAELFSSKMLRTKHAKIRKTAPITQYRFTGLNPLESLANDKLLEHLRGFAVTHQMSQMTDAHSVPVLQSAKLRALHWLNFGATGIGPATLQAIAAQPACAHLRHLELYLTNLEGHTRTLADAPLPSLQDLNIHSTRLTVDDVATLAHSPVFGSLRRLRIGDPFGAAGVQALVRSPTMTNLKHLALVRPGDLTAGAEAIARAPLASSWRHLELMGPIEHAGIEALAQSPHLAGLEALCIMEAPLDDDALRLLLASPYLRNLRQLQVTPGRITDQGTTLLLESPVTAKLEYLAVAESYLSTENIVALRQRFPKVSGSVPGTYPR